LTGNSVLDQLVRELEGLPGIGAKTAERLAYHLLKVPTSEALSLAEAIRALKEEVRECERCHNIAEDRLCGICLDESRDRTQICVVEQPKDAHVIEGTGCYRGLYHILGGNFSPLEDRGPESLSIDHLRRRIREEGIREVVIATNPDFEGDGTAMLVVEALEPDDVAVSRIARGVPAGSHLEYMNRSIISDAFAGRQVCSSSTQERKPE
jgi:recombination protein RecR